MRALWHHISESNWINFVLMGLLVYGAWWKYDSMRNELLLKDEVIAKQELRIKNAEVEAELNTKLSSEIASYFEERINNLERSKLLANEVWEGVRKVDYKWKH